MQRILPYLLAAGLLLAVGATPAFALDAASFSLGVPVSWQWTEDENDPDEEAPEAGQPSGIRAMFHTPYYIGVGVAQYTGTLKEWGITAEGEDVDVNYDLLEVMARLPLGPVWLGFGAGVGRSALDPQSIEEKDDLGNTVEVELEGGSTRERFLMAGLRLGESFDVQVGWHALVTDASSEVRFNDTLVDESDGRIGAIFTTLGAGYYF